MSNEPNPVLPALRNVEGSSVEAFAQRKSSIEQKMSNEPNLQKTINEQRTMNHEQKIQTNPIYAIFRPKTMITKKNEPNSNPIYSLYTYAADSVNQYLNIKCFLAGLIVYLGHKRWPWSKPNGLARCSHREKPLPRTQDRLKIPKNPVILSKNFVSWCLRGDEQKMSNEPNLPQPQPVTHYPTSNYGKFQRLQKPKKTGKSAIDSFGEGIKNPLSSYNFSDREWEQLLTVAREEKKKLKTSRSRKY